MGYCVKQIHPQLMISLWFHIENGDLGGDIVDRKFVSGHYLLLNGNPIVWSSVKQSIVSRSSAEAQFRAVSNVVYEMEMGQYKSLLIEMGLQLSFALAVWSDNISVVALSKNPIHHWKIKNVEIYLFFVREEVHSGEIIVNIILATEQTADIVTKPLTEITFVSCRKKYWVFSIEDVKEYMSFSSLSFTSGYICYITSTQRWFC